MADTEPRALADAMIRLRAVTRGFTTPGGGRLHALGPLDLQVPRGCLCAVVGPNGSGKSTLLHVISGLLRPDAGTVSVGGVELRGLSESALDRFRAHNIGYLLQGGQLMDCLTAEENVMAALLFGGQPRKVRRERARTALDQLGVLQRAGHLPATLSGGERQRVALARALANRPPVLLADEPLASLDREGSAAMVGLLGQLAREHGLSVLVATHHHERLSPDMVVELGHATGAGGER
jgi:putative ABC transport system ATP-binding protein